MNFQRKRTFYERIFPVLHTAALFSGISDDELAVMLSYLGARIDTFPKGSRLLRAGEPVEEVGLVLAGSTLIVQEDIWGNRNILSKTGPGQTFAEVFACAPGAVLNVSVEAESAVTVMFLHIRRVLSVCPSACSHHSRIIRNLLDELAEKNLRLNEKLTHMAQRTTRAKLMSYFPPRHSGAASMSSTFRFQGSSLRITSVWSAAGCLWSLEKCGMRACSTFTKAISFSKRRRLTVPFLLRVKEPSLGVLASTDNPVSHGASGFCRWKKQLYYAKNTAAEYICGCVLCSVAHCCVDWIWRDNISPDLTWVILSAITLAVCLADMSASPLRSYPA